jgi:diguanylate cyclase (GGDEF)-like protein/PAS domain S-box-containing protein
MRAPLRAAKHHHESLPVQIYISTVNALYSDARSLFVGTTSATVAALVTFWKSGDWTLLVCAIAILLVGVVRGFEMRRYSRLNPGPTSAEEARRWENRYTFISATSVAVMGMWVLLAFARTSDPTVHLISFSMVLVYLLGITGRNFSSDRLVVTQTVCAAVPMITGLLIQNSAYHYFLAALFVPFFISIRIISARLRGILFDAVIATHDIKALAAQFDTALNNMPHGLCMFDEKQRFVVANGRFGRLLGLKERDLRGVSANEIVAECLHSGRVSAPMMAGFGRQFLDMLVHDMRDQFSIETDVGQTLELTFQPMEKGGCVVLIEDITERRSAEARIEHLARYDALTGLPNRTSFTEQFEHTVAETSGAEAHAVLFIDLDEFKQVNDTLGHPCGDALLCEVAERLRKAVRETDVVARFGGDEFVVLQSLRNGREDAGELADNIIRSLRDIYVIEGHQIVVGASIGISMRPQGGSTADQLLKSADIALYRAKSDGRGVWRFFEPEMDARAQARRALELDIREAIARDEFDLHFQPILDVKSGLTTTCEALLRWTHPRRGMVSPAEFIPVAEEMGLIVDIGHWVMHKACRTCLQWPEEVRLAVNLSSIQFRRGNVEEMIADALQASGLPAARLEIEITESVLLQDTATTRIALQNIRDMGVTISLDDFGTGYSSLSYLQSFPLNKVKIDRSFLSGIETNERAMTLLRGVARLSADLGLTVVVEGVETQAQLAMLTTEKSVEEVQGFLFSPGIPSARVHEHLRKERQQRFRVA